MLIGACAFGVERVLLFLLLVPGSAALEHLEEFFGLFGAHVVEIYGRKQFHIAPPVGRDYHSRFIRTLKRAREM